jgi:hypothetical protein
VAYFQDISMPPELDLGPGYVVRISAYDASSGAAITGVTVSDFSIECDDLTGAGGAELASGPFMLVPGPGA